MCFEYNIIQFTFATVHSNRLMKKGGGLGPMKPWQPVHWNKVPNPIPFKEKDKYA